MKIALYIEDGLEQIVLTPENKAEQNILGKLHYGSRSLEIHRGKFYECRGGWMRHGYLRDFHLDANPGRDDDESTMIVLRPCIPAGCEKPTE